MNLTLGASFGYSCTEDLITVLYMWQSQLLKLHKGNYLNLICGETNTEPISSKFKASSECLLKEIKDCPAIVNSFGMKTEICLSA